MNTKVTPKLMKLHGQDIIAIEVEKMEIDPTEVKKAYNGKVGCMCGCLGTYAYQEEKPSTVKSRTNALLKKFESGEFDEISVHFTKTDLTKIEYIYISYDAQNDGRRENDGRCFCLYFSE